MTSTTTVQALAAQLGCSTSVIYKAVEEGRIRHLRIGRRILIPKGEGSRLIAEATGTNGSEPPQSTPAVGSSADRLVQVITTQVTTINALKADIRDLRADLKNVSELLAVLVKELTA
jgi:excisionase family DNA binding protein